jgi:hypothetical protein
MAMRMVNFARRHAAQSLAFAGLAILAGWVARADAQSARPDLMRSPFHMERILDHGERPDWSPEGRKLVFTQSDVRDTPAYEIDLATRKVRCLTCKFGKLGLVTRIYYLPDGNFLILAPLRDQPGGRPAFMLTGLYWLSAKADAAPQPLGAPAMGEIAHGEARREGVPIAWGAAEGTRSVIVQANLRLIGGKPVLADRHTIYSFDASTPSTGGPTFAETYNFARDGRAITFWSVTRPDLDSGMYEVDLDTGRTQALYVDPAHNETHLFPDERFGLEESNRDSDPAGPLRGVSGLDAAALRATARGLGVKVGSAEDLAAYARFGSLRGVGRPFDLYVVKIGSPVRVRRLTHVSNLGGAAHQSVPAPDGRRIAFALETPETGPLRGRSGLYIGWFGNRR